MRYRRLGTSDIEVSELCLGTMTWGTQNTEAEGHRQIEIALDAGVTFIDTAEMYPTPARAETAGITETILGNWLVRPGNRTRAVIASKVAGAGQAPRNGAPITAASLRGALEDSLRRLKTDVIDLYQLHVPSRGTWAFRRNWGYDPSTQDRAQVADNMAEVMAELAAQVKAGRIRHVGLSNETAWGIAAWNRAAAAAGGPRVATIQNEYSLLARLFDTDLAETSHHEQVPLLAFSPIAAGLLSDKYAGGAVPAGSRLSLTPGLGGRVTPWVWPAVAAYVGIARRHGLDPAQMALAWVLTRPFLGAAIFGATSEAQLRNALGAADLSLSPELMQEIEETHRVHPVPY